jgi:hypothetical protein
MAAETTGVAHVPVPSASNERSLAEDVTDEVDEFIKQTEEVFGAVDAKSSTNADGQPWEYALQIPAFNPNDPTHPNTEDALRIIGGLVNMFGEKCVAVLAHGTIDRGHAFIKVTASREFLENEAELDKLEVRVNPKRGRGYRYYTRRGHANAEFAHPILDPSVPDYDERVKRDFILLPYQRQEIIRERIEIAFDNIFERKAGRGLEYALKSRRVSQILALHTLKTDERVPDPYPSLKTVVRRYCGWAASFLSVLYFSKLSREFTSFLRDYMGEKIALYFCFLHFYTTWLLLLAVFGLGLAFYQYTANASDNELVPIYCLIVAVWSTVFLEYWKRRNSELAFDWNMLQFEEHEREIDTFASEDQEKFPGFYEKYGAWVDMKEWLDKVGKPKYGESIGEFVQWYHRDEAGHCPECCFACYKDKYLGYEMNTRVWRFFKEFVSTGVVLTMMAGVVAISLALLYLRLIMQQDVNAVFGGAAAGVMQAIAIAVCDVAFSKVAVMLNNWENHRTATEYEDRLIAKEFFFLFVNNFFSLYYIAFFKGNGVGRKSDLFFGRADECQDVQGNPSESCMTELSFQLTSMLITRMIIGNLVEYAIPALETRFNIWRRLKDAKAEVRRERPNASNNEIKEELKRRGYIKSNIDVVEKQAHQPDYNINRHVSGTFTDYSELVIQFGYVTLFAPAFPLAPIIAVLSNVIEHRNDGWKILLSCRKSDYHGAQDIGTWFHIFRFLALVSVITNMLVIGFTSNQLGELFGDPSDAIKLAIVIGLEHAIFSLEFFLSYMIPDEPRQ